MLCRVRIWVAEGVGWGESVSESRGDADCWFSLGVGRGREGGRTSACVAGCWQGQGRVVGVVKQSEVGKGSSCCVKRVL